MLELYKDLIIDHGINPRNKYAMQKYTHHAIAYNHFCGDSFTLYINIINNKIEGLSFTGEGCSISTASASLMSIMLKNKTIEEGLNIFDYFQNLIKNDINKNEMYQTINILSNVKNFPSRVKCATLIWHTFKNSIKHNGGTNE